MIVARARTPSLSFYPRLAFAPAEVGARSGERPIRLTGATPFEAFRDGVAVQSRAARKKVVERWQMRLIVEILNNSLSTANHFKSRCVTFSTHGVTAQPFLLPPAYLRRLQVLLPRKPYSRVCTRPLSRSPYLQSWMTQCLKRRPSTRSAYRATRCSGYAPETTREEGHRIDCCADIPNLP
jgi:hypothetical protein